MAASRRFGGNSGRRRLAILLSGAMVCSVFFVFWSGDARRGRKDNDPTSQLRMIAVTGRAPAAASAPPWWVLAFQTGAQQPVAVRAAPPPPSCDGYTVSGAGVASVNGCYTKQASGSYVKDQQHALYPYHGFWHIGTKGKAVFYASLRPSSDPPKSSGGCGVVWAAYKNSGVPPCPVVTRDSHGPLAPAPPPVHGPKTGMQHHHTDDSAGWRDAQEPPWTLDAITPPCNGSALVAKWESLRKQSEIKLAREIGLFEDVTMRRPTSLRKNDAARDWDSKYKGEDSTLWSLRKPKVDLVKILAEKRCLTPPSTGLVSVLLGCGEGYEIDYMLRWAGGESIVAGVDFAESAVQYAREAFRQPGAFFYHSDVCDLPVPTVPVDLIVDNTVWQNVRRNGQALCYRDTLRRLSSPGRTVLYLNMMNAEGVRNKNLLGELKTAKLSLPLNERAWLEEAFSPDWRLEWLREGIYDLNIPTCKACQAMGGIPSWSAMLVRRAAVR
jgi:hypothetical protein